MAKGPRYSTFKESSNRDSWTTRKITRYITSIWLLSCCCDSCCAKQRTASALRSNGTNGAKKRANSKSQIPSDDSVISKDDVRLTMEDVLTKRDYEVTKDNVLSTALDNCKNEEAASLINRKETSLTDSSDANNQPSTSNKSLSSGMKRMIISLPVLAKKEKKLPVDEEKKASESESQETERPTTIFTKCSKRHKQENSSTINIPKLIIS